MNAADHAQQYYKIMEHSCYRMCCSIRVSSALLSVHTHIVAFLHRALRIAVLAIVLDESANLSQFIDASRQMPVAADDLIDCLE